MSKFATIAALGPAALQSPQDINGQKALDTMLAHWKRQFDLVLSDQPDIIVVPECCDRFQSHSMKERKDYYQFRRNQMRDAFASIAADNHCYIAYSAVIEKEDGSFRNATQIIDRHGTVAGVYHKNHLVIEENTECGILYGKDAPLIECDFGKVACAICFDLNFQELRDKYAAASPDLIVFCSMYHGGLAQRWWACQCQSHFVGAISGGQCEILSPQGETIASSTNYTPYVTARVNLDCSVIHLDYNVEKLQAVREKYKTAVKVHDPGKLGTVLLSSESDAFTVDDIIREFEIETWRDYYARALCHRQTSGVMEA